MFADGWDIRTPRNAATPACITTKTVDIVTNMKTPPPWSSGKAAVSSGVKARRSSPSCPSEHVEHRNFISEFRKTWPCVLIHSIPNGGKRGKVTAHKLRLEGLTPGIPDTFIPEWLLWVEMKRQKGGGLSPEQKEIIQYLESVGHTVIVARGCGDAIAKIYQFLESQ